MELIEELYPDGMSLPMRGAWIEMVWQAMKDNNIKVAPHAGSVD